MLTYNEEDCGALKLLTDELSRIEENANILHDIDFVNSPKRNSSAIGEHLHNQFENILTFASAHYDNKKISLRDSLIEAKEVVKKIGGKEGHQAYHRIIAKPQTIIVFKRPKKCPRHPRQKLESKAKTTERSITDLVFTKNGVKKRRIKYIGEMGYCSKCHNSYSSEEIAKIGLQPFGHGFKSWIIYQRLVLRLSYGTIVQVLGDIFHEQISDTTITNIQRYFYGYYSETEKINLAHLLNSPFIHADETKISIDGINQYVWVFTDGKHVLFRLTETREATMVHELLADYHGVLISDFYAGYDSLKCDQQKCWSHLIRDLNDDLWKEPFNTEFENFVLNVKNLIVPILSVVEKRGLKTRYLKKFQKSVEKFYSDVIVDKSYNSDLIATYQKRFIRYKRSLFTFLEKDGIPWNNNMAERAIRHLAIQRKISGHFSESVAPKYLLLLGIMQTCRFQNKSLLKFLLSGEKDVEAFKKSRPIKYSKRYVKKIIKAYDQDALQTEGIF